MRTLCTALSPGIRAQADAIPLIADRQGRRSFLHGFLRQYNGNIEDGDEIMRNDPCRGEGKVPGAVPTDATSIFGEGFRRSPVPLYRKGVLQPKPANTATLPTTPQARPATGGPFASPATCPEADRRKVRTPIQVRLLHA